MKTRADQLFDQFREFHLANPEVWRMFCKFARSVIEAGFPRYSADAIFHRIRWHVQIEVKSQALKLNDHHTAYYARLWMVAHPERSQFFNLRRRPSKEQYPSGEIDLLSPPEQDDEPLRAELKKLIPKD